MSAPKSSSLARLAPVPQIVVRNGAGNHGLADRHGTDADAGIVPAPGHDLDLVAPAVDGAALVQRPAVAADR